LTNQNKQNEQVKLHLYCRKVRYNSIDEFKFVLCAKSIHYETTPRIIIVGLKNNRYMSGNRVFI